MNSTIGFAVGSNNGERICVDVRIIDNLAFNKLRIFSVHILILELDFTGIQLHLGWAWFHIINNDCEWKH